MKHIKFYSAVVVCALCGCIGTHSKYCESAEAYHTEIQTAGETQQATPKVLNPSSVVSSSGTSFVLNAEPGSYSIAGIPAALSKEE